MEIHDVKGKTTQRLIINESEDGPGGVSVILDFEDKTDLEVRLEPRYKWEGALHDWATGEQQTLQTFPEGFL